MRKTVLIVFVFLFQLALPAQQRHVRKANDALNERQYYTAITFYEKGLQRFKGSDTARNEVVYRLAECYHMTRNLPKAEEEYNALIGNKYEELEPKVLFHYANVLQDMGKFKEAITLYDQFLQVVPSDTLADSCRASCLLALSPFVFDERYVLTNLAEVNTTADEFAAIYGNAAATSIIFTSTRIGTTGKEKEFDNWTGGRMSDLFVVIQHGDSISSKSVLLDETELINTAANEGTPLFNEKFTRFYFTRCKLRAEISEFCKIFQVNKRGKKWGRPFEVYGTSTGNVGHPALSGDELTIYFSSNRLGGQGGKDLWKATRFHTDEPFYDPVNLGPEINSAGDEMFPAVVADTALFFASNGRVGFGGLDIYKAVAGGQGIRISHLPPPFNTIEDDFAISYQKGFERGFLSSRRAGGAGGDDIYYFKRIPLNLNLNGIVRDDSSFMPVPKATVFLFGDQGDTSVTTSNENGYYHFDSAQIKEDVFYDLFVEKENYFNKRSKLNTFYLIKDSTYTEDVYLQPIPRKPIVLPDIYYDFAKWDLLPQYEDSLQVLVEIMVDNPKLVIELSSHTDARGSDKYNKELSQKRAKSAVDYLISQGINEERMVAKGYGEQQPRLLNKDFERDGFLFAEGTKLTESYIRKLRTEQSREAAHQLNRRTEFRVLRKDFVPKNKVDRK
ncbi:MAG: OmpA family protein [Bacteroidales bacterium]|nr:OmpA family protein [Bacteroidales bacterium]